jgi:hypothetical protein
MEWVHQYGAVPAQMLFATHILPKLLANAAQNKAQTLIRTFEGLSVDLNKADNAPPPAPKKKAPPLVPWYEAVVNWNGQKTRVGRVYPNASNADRHLYPIGGMPLLGADDKYLYMVNAQMPSRNFPMEDDGTVKPWWGPNDVIKVPRHTGSIDPMEGDWSVETFPQKLEGRKTVDAEKDGVGDYLHHDDVKQMVHGLDFSQKRLYSGEGIQANTSFWGKLPDGSRAYFKRAPAESQFNAARKDALAYNLSRDFFKLDKYFTPTALVRSPIDGGEYAVVKGLAGKTGFEWQGDLSFGGLSGKGVTGLRDAHDAGDLHKLEMFDTIMNNGDRHLGNVMFDKTGKPFMIDHGHAMTLRHSAGAHNQMRNLAREVDSLIDQHNQRAAAVPGSEHIEPFDFSQTQNRSWHPEAVKWVAGLNEHEFDKHLIRHGVLRPLRAHLVRRMKLLKEAVGNGNDVDQTRYYVARAGKDVQDGTTPEPITAPGQGPTADVPVIDNPGDIASDGRSPRMFEEMKHKAKEPVRKPKRLVN